MQYIQLRSLLPLRMIHLPQAFRHSRIITSISTGSAASSHSDWLIVFRARISLLSRSVLCFLILHGMHSVSRCQPEGKMTFFRMSLKATSEGLLSRTPPPAPLRHSYARIHNQPGKKITSSRGKSCDPYNIFSANKPQIQERVEFTETRPLCATAR